MNYRLLLGCCMYLVLACKSKPAADEEVADAPEQRTPVTIAEAAVSPLENFVELNATSAFLQSNIIKASANGYIRQVNLALGAPVIVGQTVFILRTREAEALGNTINKLDPSFHFTGIIPIRSSSGGYVQELNHKPGDYVQDGEQLAVVADASSFGFVLNMPYELRARIGAGATLDIVLPDGRHVSGQVARVLPSVDSVAQTQQVLLRVQERGLPENLIARVRIVTGKKEGALSLPKAAVLADEAQQHFWVMQLIDTATAVKVPVIKGLETADRIEIVNPKFKAGDRFVLSGNYGLPDTAKVFIQKEQP